METIRDADLVLRVEKARYCHDRENNPGDTDGDGGGPPKRRVSVRVQSRSDRQRRQRREDPCDSDADESDGQDWEDNCPTIVNPDQKEGPFEGVGAACMPQTDRFCGISPIRVRAIPFAALECLV